MNSNSPLRNYITNTVEISIRMIFLFLLISWCLFLLYPFIVPVLWAVILAVSLSPLYLALSKKLGDKPKLSAGLIVIVFLAVILVPSYFFIDSMIENLTKFGQGLISGGLHVPPPNEKVAAWPLIGENVYAFWQAASEDLQEVLRRYSEQLRVVGKAILDLIVGLTSGIFQMVVSLIISGILLATKGTKELTHKFFRKLVGERGEEFANLTEKTIRNVTKGILGVAFIQAILVGVLFYLAGIPYAGILTMAVLILGIMQLPPGIVTIPVIIYMYANMSAGMATVWTVLILLASLSDNVLKPILLGQGAAVPMLVIFLGAIGGFIVSGFLGLFTGAIVLSLGYKLLLSWLNEEQEEDVKHPV